MKFLKNLFTVLLLSSCASLTKVSKNNDETIKIKKVAVIGFSLISQEPDSVWKRLLRKAKLNLSSTGNMNGGVHPDATQIYSEFLEKLKLENNWQTLSEKELDRQFEYHKLVTDKTTGLVVRAPIPENFTVYRADGVLDAEAFASISSQEKEKILKDLNVDAIVVLKVISNLEEEGGIKKYIGQSEFRPKVQVAIEVFKGDCNKSIWSDSWAWGTADKAIPSKMRAVDSADLMTQVKVATKYAYNDLFNRFKEENK